MHCHFRRCLFTDLPLDVTSVIGEFFARDNTIGFLDSLQVVNDSVQDGVLPILYEPVLMDNVDRPSFHTTGVQQDYWRFRLRALIHELVQSP